MARGRRERNFHYLSNFSLNSAGELIFLILGGISPVISVSMVFTPGSTYMPCQYDLAEGDCTFSASKNVVKCQITNFTSGFEDIPRPLFLWLAPMGWGSEKFERKMICMRNMSSLKPSTFRQLLMREF